jgi:hypothetical protein
MSLSTSTSVRGKPQRVISVNPDATFSIADRDQSKTLLFFLEVDLGTETLASPKRELTDIRQKILNHGTCFDLQVHKRYEKLWSFGLNGFRLLVLTDTLVRLSTLSSLVQEMPSPARRRCRIAGRKETKR